MKKEIHFRKMELADLEAVSEMEKRCFSMPWSKETYEQVIQDEECVYVVALVDGQIVASGGVRNILSEGEITNVMVDCMHRGQGISNLLIKKLIEYGQAIQIESFFLEVRAGNLAAIACYTKNGFTIEGKRKNLYDNPKEDGFVMWKR